MVADTNSSRSEVVPVACKYPLTVYVQKETEIYGKQGQLAKLRDAWETQNSVENKNLLCVCVCDKLYFFRWMSALGNPLVQDEKVFVLDGQMSESFLT